LSRADLVEVRADSFMKDGRTIRFQRVWLTRRGRLAGTGEVDGVRLVETVAGSTSPRRSGGRSVAGTAAPKAVRKAAETALSGDELTLFERLRAWRLEEARRRRVPAFRILTDRTLSAICRARPSDEEELLDVAGIGPTTVRKHGRKILTVVNAAPPEDGET
jgi:superfamily II DNA helicase RecQ